MVLLSGCLAIIKIDNRKWHFVIKTATKCFFLKICRYGHQEIRLAKSYLMEQNCFFLIEIWPSRMC